MQTDNFRALVESVRALSKAINKQVSVGGRKVIGKQGQPVTSQMIEWYGQVMAVNGVWTIDYSAAGFKEILNVDPKAVYDALSFNDQAIASLNEVSLKQARGKVVKGASQIFKTDGITQGPTCLVMVRVVGI